AGVVNAAKANSRSHGKTASVRKEIWNSRIRDCEGVERIRDWHANTAGAKAHVKPRNLERIRRKWNSCQRRIEVGADKFEVREYCQVLVTKIARERTVEALTISRSKRGRYRSKIIEEVVPAAFITSAELRNVLECIGANDAGRAGIRI